MVNATIENRRPLKSRRNKLFQNVAVWLNRRSVTPNQISITSLFFAGLAATCFCLLPRTSDGLIQCMLLVLAAVFIQARLLCNLLDGLVAIEGGKATPSGELFNEIPDRIADPLILVAVGYGITVTEFSSSLGWFAALLSVLTAYVRVLSSLSGAPADFKGPMAKQHRMASITCGCLLTAFEVTVWQTTYALLICLMVVIAGTLITVIRRTISAYLFLEDRK